MAAICCDLLSFSIFDVLETTNVLAAGSKEGL